MADTQVETPEIHDISEQMPSDSEVQAELAKEPGEKLEATPAGAAAANERLRVTIEQGAGIGTDGDAFGMETKLIDKLVGHE
ncbi:MAG: hypothetical protein NVSMB32_13420 [Actinomycetota bacterium]